MLLFALVSLSPSLHVDTSVRHVDTPARQCGLVKLGSTFCSSCSDEVDAVLVGKGVFGVKGHLDSVNIWVIHESGWVIAINGSLGVVASFSNVVKLWERVFILRLVSSLI